MLYRQWKQAPVVVTTGPVRSHGKLIDTAPAMRQALEDGGVPATMIWTENQSRTTYENALHTAALLRSRGVGRIALVTEAHHMLRSVRAFEQQGIAVSPAPCAYRSVRFDGNWKEYLLPRPESMLTNEASLHEWAGLLWYSLSGKIGRRGTP